MIETTNTLGLIIVKPGMLIFISEVKKAYLSFLLLFLPWSGKPIC